MHCVSVNVAVVWLEGVAQSVSEGAWPLRSRSRQWGAEQSLSPAESPEQWGAIPYSLGWLQRAGASSKTDGCAPL